MPPGTALIDWPAWKDQVVLWSLGGRTQAEIVEILAAGGRKITRQGISKIINDPRAEEVIKIYRAKLREGLMETIHDELDVASQLALKAIKRTLEADIAPIHKAKPNQDKVALKVLAGRGFLREESRTSEQGLHVPPDAFSRLVDAMDRADAAKEIVVEFKDVTPEEDSDGEG